MLQRAQSFLEHGGSIKAMTQIRKKKKKSCQVTNTHDVSTIYLLKITTSNIQRSKMVVLRKQDIRRTTFQLVISDR